MHLNKVTIPNDCIHVITLIWILTWPFSTTARFSRCFMSASVLLWLSVISFPANWLVCSGLSECLRDYTYIFFLIQSRVIAIAQGIHLCSKEMWKSTRIATSVSFHLCLSLSLFFFHWLCSASCGTLCVPSPGPSEEYRLLFHTDRVITVSFVLKSK